MKKSKDRPLQQVVRAKKRGQCPSCEGHRTIVHVAGSEAWTFECPLCEGTGLPVAAPAEPRLLIYYVRNLPVSYEWKRPAVGGNGGGSGIPGGAQRPVPAGEADGSGAFHPNVQDAFRTLAMAAECFESMSMFWMAKELRRSQRTIADHLTRKSASGGN